MRVAWVLLLAACSTTEVPDMQAQTAEPPRFGDARAVTITGYTDHVMEPSLSRDGRFLFFNNLNDPSVDTNLHWASRVDDLTFTYEGPIAGANTPSLDGVPSMDRDGTFYFVSTRSYAQTSSTLYRARFAAGALTDVALVPGVSAATPGIVNFDAEVSPDGRTLYFVEAEFGMTGPKSADILVATRAGDGFVRGARLANVNTAGALEYAPAISDSGLELYFTRFDGTLPEIYVAVRADAGTPFGTPVKLIPGFVEAPTLSPDEKSLYYHKKENDRFVLYRMTRL